jgi:hypothetical protein
MGRRDGCVQLVARELGGAWPLVTRREHCTGRHDLDHIRACRGLLAHGFDHLADAIGLPVHPRPR